MLRQGVNSDGVVMRDAYVEHDPVDLFCPPEEGMCRQEFARECDINVLMATYEKSGVIAHWNKGTPQYLDLGEVPDLHTALSVLDRAQQAFMSLPATVRREFDNDPLKFVEFAENAENLPKMREWGLAKPLLEDPPPVKVQVIPDPAAVQAAPKPAGA